MWPFKSKEQRKWKAAFHSEHRAARERYPNQAGFWRDTDGQLKPFTSVHVGGYDNKTLCGKVIKELADEEPNGAIVHPFNLTSSFTPSQKKAILEERLKMVTCQECKEAARNLKCPK